MKAARSSAANRRRRMRGPCLDGCVKEGSANEALQNAGIRQGSDSKGYERRERRRGFKSGGRGR